VTPPGPTEAPFQLGYALLGGVILLLVVRAFAAALEASLVAVGQPRAQALASVLQAPRRARALGALAAHPEPTAFTLRAVSALSIAAAGLLSGWAGALLLPGLSPWTGGILVTLAAGLLSLPLGALGRGLGAAHGERVALLCALPFRAVALLLTPLAHLVAILGGRWGRFSLPLPPLDEMERALHEYARREGPAAAGTSELIHAVFAFREKVARDVMVPRTDVVAVEIDTPVEEIVRLLAEEGHSRMPVYRESLDQIVGVLHARDLVPLLANPHLIVLRDILRPAHFIPWSKPIEQLLREMQRQKLHMAFVVDEHGGVMGVCTIEDVLEEIVGDIRDEFEEEEDEPREIERHADGTFTVLGSTAIDAFNQATGAEVPEDEGFETVGGFVNSLAGLIPAKGDRLSWRGWIFTVADADPRRVIRVRAARTKRAG
jgi:putative hemolysin